MGYYIQGPTKGKAEFLIQEHGAVEVVDLQVLSIFDNEPDSAIISVVDNGPFEAAAFAYSREELEVFMEQCHDQRPKRWLKMDRAKAEELSGYKR